VRDGEAGRAGLLDFLRGHWPALLFGGLHAFCSFPGQTIVVGVFIPSFAAAFGLSAGEIGGLYMLANLGSAATLLAVGHLIDVVPLRLFSSAVIAGLAASCALLAIAPHPLILGLGFYAVRLTGQGLMVHIEATATGRAFSADRGRALGITALGLPIADGAMPGLMVAAIAVLGWRPAYGTLAAVLIVVVLPLARALAARIPAGPVVAVHSVSHLARLGAALGILAREPDRVGGVAGLCHSAVHVDRGVFLCRRHRRGAGLAARADRGCFSGDRRRAMWWR
jgi:MFS family permease